MGVVDRHPVLLSYIEEQDGSRFTSRKLQVWCKKKGAELWYGANEKLEAHLANKRQFLRSCETKTRPAGYLEIVASGIQWALKKHFHKKSHLIYG